MKNRYKVLTVVVLVIAFAFVFAACGGESFDPTELQNELNELKGKYGELQTKHDALQTELNTAKTDLNGAIADKQSKIDALQSDVTAKQTQINKLLADGTAAQEDIDFLQTELNDKQAQLNQLYDELTKTQSDLSSLESALFIYKSILIGDWDGQNSTYTASNRVRAGLRYIELGEYPCNYVGDTLNTALTNAYNGGGLAAAATGKSYTSNSSTTSGTYTPKTSPEYLYNGQKYVRVSILSYGDSYPFSTGTNNGASGTIHWFKVEPIKWLVMNWDALPKSINPYGTGADAAFKLVAAELITAGVPFGATGVTLWENSVVRTFLNETFYNEAFDAVTRGKIAATSVPNNTTTTNSTDGDGTATTDKVYLPSYYEVFNASGTYNKVFDTFAKRPGVLTDFAIANYAFMGSTSNTSSYYRMGCWCLRSASSSSNVRSVYAGGSDDYVSPILLHYGLRPACALALS